MKTLKLSVLALLFPCFGLFAQNNEDEQQGQQGQEQTEEVDKSDDEQGNFLNLEETNVMLFGGKMLKEFHALLLEKLGSTDIVNKFFKAKMAEKALKLTKLLKAAGANNKQIKEVVAAVKDKFEAKMKKALEEDGDEGKAEKPAPAEETPAPAEASEPEEVKTN